MSGQVGADDRAVLDQIIDSLTSLAMPNENNRIVDRQTNKISLIVGKVEEMETIMENGTKKKMGVLILGAGRVCQPAAELLASIGSNSSPQWYKTHLQDDFEVLSDVHVIVASLYLKDAEEVQQTFFLPNSKIFLKKNCKHLYVRHNNNLHSSVFDSLISSYFMFIDLILLQMTVIN